MKKALIQEFLHTLLFQLSYRFIQPQQATNELVILFFNRTWGQPFDFQRLRVPPGVALTDNRWRFREAAAVVFHIPSLNWLYPLKKQVGQLWVAWSLESEAHYPQLCAPRFMSQFDLTMSYHQRSDVVTSYFSYYGSTDNLKRALLEPPKPKTEENFANLFVSSPHDKSGRREYATELMRYLDIHSYGKFLNNRSIQGDLWRPSKLSVIANYKFTLAFENAITPDYVSEKFFDPLVAGSVPVYLGAPNVEDFAPGDRCFINTADFDSPKALAEYLLALNENDSAYQTYFTWKQKPLRPRFLRMLKEQQEEPFVRLCHKVKAIKQAGLITSHPLISRREVVR